MLHSAHPFRGPLFMILATGSYVVNDTMMNHPLHLHGMWSELDNGAGAYKPRKHVINIKPAERLSFEVTADALGEWAFHCHLLYHMEAGMFRRVIVTQDAAANG